MVVVTAPEVVRDTTFIRLKVPIQSAKIAKKKKAKQWPNNTSPRLNPRN
jgi:hypothetical protein